MKIAIENKFVVKTINFFYDMPLKGRQSRHRSKLLNKLTEHLATVTEDEKALLKEHCNLDDVGEPKRIIEDGRELWDLKDPVAYSKERQELLAECFILDGGANEAIIRTLATALDEYAGDLQGEAADFYDVLCGIFEAAGAEEE